MDEGVAQARMLVIARESRGLRQGEVAAAMQALEGPGSKVSQAYVSRAESGRLTVTGDRLELFASALGYPVGLLTRAEAEMGAGVGLIHHRKKQAAPALELRRIHALLHLSRTQLRRLVAGVPRCAELAVPRVDVDDFTSPEDAARLVRAEWGLPAGPLDSVVGAVERAGGLVLTRELLPPVPLDSGNTSVPVDAVSCFVPDEDPVVLLNAGTPGDRQRFTLAHELGHMVMHSMPHPDQERQADRFAAELLMPAKDIRDDLGAANDLRALIELKRRWRVSVWALMRRAHTLGKITDWQYRNLAVEMTSLGFRTTEPDPLDAERPGAVPDIVRWHLDADRTPDDLAELVLLNREEFDSLYRPPLGGNPRATCSPLYEVLS